MDFEELSAAFRRARRARATEAFEAPGRAAVAKWEALLRRLSLGADEWFRLVDGAIHERDGHLT